MRQLKLITAAIAVLAALTALTAASAFAEEGFLPTTNFVGSGTGGKLQALGSLEITCTKTSILSGVMTNDKSGTVDVHYSGCSAFGFPANSLGDASGVILAPSNWELCLLNSTTLEFAIFLAPKAAVHIEVPLFGALIIVNGGVWGKITPNTKGKTKTISFSETSGDPAIASCGGKASTQTAEENENGKKEMSGLNGSATVEAENKTTEIEIMDT
jgi:hypothetical protein